MAELISHRLLGGAFCDLGQYTQAQEHTEKARKNGSEDGGEGPRQCLRDGSLGRIEV